MARPGGFVVLILFSYSSARTQRYTARPSLGKDSSLHHLRTSMDPAEGSSGTRFGR
jgi:hypothetical protein